MPAHRPDDYTLPDSVPARSRYSGLNRQQPRQRMTRGNTIMIWTVALVLLFTVIGAVQGNNSSKTNTCPSSSKVVQ